jgi:hypothetical protein
LASRSPINLGSRGQSAIQTELCIVLVDLTCDRPGVSTASQQPVWTYPSSGRAGGAQGVVHWGAVVLLVIMFATITPLTLKHAIFAVLPGVRGGVERAGVLTLSLSVVACVLVDQRPTISQIFVSGAHRGGRIWDTLGPRCDTRSVYRRAGIADPS